MIQNIKTHKKWVDVVKSCANLFFTNKTLDLIRILFSLNLHSWGFTNTYM